MLVIVHYILFFFFATCHSKAKIDASIVFPFLYLHCLPSVRVILKAEKVTFQQVHAVHQSVSCA